MHKEIFTEEQIKLLPLLTKFSDRFYLVGGTAIALQLGHRRSVDFDLFSPKSFRNSDVIKKVKEYGAPEVFVDEINEVTLSMLGVKMTFYHYEYPVKRTQKLDNYIKMPDLLNLASMKAFALGRRAKWKDYVDLYFLLEKFGFANINQNTLTIYGDEYSERMLREQLSYFDDINYSEKVDFMPGFEVSEEAVKEALINHAVS